MPNPILGVVGSSGSGKTTLLEKLLPLFVARGLRVNIVKHSHHDITLEPPQKDSARLRAAGASEVLLASPYRYVIVRELREEPEPPLEELLARLSPADLTLVESYQGADLPKLEVYRPANDKPPRYTANANIIAVASDTSAPADWNPAHRWLDLNQPEQVLNWMLDFAGQAG